MMRDMHVHTTFCDGNNSPEEMVRAAIQKGMTEIGFTAHSYTFFDESYCMKKEDTAAYQAEIRRLQQCYGDKIRIHLGIEQDYYSDMPTDAYEYIIGSVHYVKVGNEYMPMDDPPFEENVEKYFGGDYYALAEAYFGAVADVVNKTGCQIIGHLDLLTKFNEGGKLFDENHPRYVAAWQRAVDALLPHRIPFEINMGAISRGYRTTPYPSAPIRAYIKANGGKLMLSGDAHSADGLCYLFEEYEGAL
ncbi:MAG: histidinol-phosphatase [Clostridia bacterium]|nr:histidinol-phosphatase [Clostridia bacterium]